MKHPVPDELEPSYVENARRPGGWERVEHLAALPGTHGFECTVYQLLYYRTLHLAAQVYVTCASEGVEFRPTALEHHPRVELINYQMKNVFAGEERRRQEKHIPADELLRQARALQSETLSLLLRADRATDLRTALLAVREARSTVELLAVTMRQLTADTAMYRGGSE